MALTAVPKVVEFIYRLTSIYSYSTVDCYSREDFQIFNDDVLDIKIGETWKIAQKSYTGDQVHTWDYSLHILTMTIGQNTQMKLISHKSMGYYVDSASERKPTV